MEIFIYHLTKRPRQIKKNTVQQLLLSLFLFLIEWHKYSLVRLIKFIGRLIIRQNEVHSVGEHKNILTVSHPEKRGGSWVGH